MSGSATFDCSFVHDIRARVWSGLLLCSLLGAGAAFGQASTPVLTPQPREIRAGGLLPLRSAAVLVPGGDAEDFFAAQDLSKVLAERGIAVAPAVGQADFTVVLLRMDSAEAKQFLAEEKISFEAAMHDEGYVLISRAGRVTIIGETAAGGVYGAQTVQQLVESEGGVRRNLAWA